MQFIETCLHLSSTVRLKIETETADYGRFYCNSIVGLKTNYGYQISKQKPLTDFDQFCVLFEYLVVTEPDAVVGD